MRKIIGYICAFLFLAVAIVLLSGCGNKQLFDTNYTFNKAIMNLPNGDLIEGRVESWKDFEDGDQIQVKIQGIVYLVHSSDIALISE